MTTEAGTAIDITQAIDDGPVSPLLVQTGILCAVIAVLVGLDTSSINVAAPLIARRLGLSQAHLGPIFSAALLGSLLGALRFGSLADRLGRKRMLVVVTLAFGVFTFATATATAASFGTLLLVRFLAGIGLGGAIPCLITLASEYAPRRHRAMVTSLIWTGFPTGVITSSFLNAVLLRHSAGRPSSVERSPHGSCSPSCGPLARIPCGWRSGREASRALCLGCQSRPNT